MMYSHTLNMILQSRCVHSLPKPLQLDTAVMQATSTPVKKKTNQNQIPHLRPLAHLNATSRAGEGRITIRGTFPSPVLFSALSICPLQTPGFGEPYSVQLSLASDPSYSGELGTSCALHKLHMRYMEYSILAFLDIPDCGACGAIGAVNCGRCELSHVRFWVVRIASIGDLLVLRIGPGIWYIHFPISIFYLHSLLTEYSVLYTPYSGNWSRVCGNVNM